MNIVGMMAARNSEWILGASARAALGYCDKLVIMDHASTDKTPSLIREIQDERGGDRVHSFRVDDPVWREMEQRNAMLEAAKTLHPTHLILIDDDEILTANLRPYIFDRCREMKPGDTLEVPWLCMWQGIDRYRADASHWSQAYVSFGVAYHPEMHFRPADDGYQHHSRRPRGAYKALIQFPPPGYPKSSGGLMHFQFASDRRLRAKQALYKMNEVIHFGYRMSKDEINRMYDGTTLDVPKNLEPVPADWWDQIRELRKHIDVDATPWQEMECKHLWEKHGAGMFAGLNLYGVL